MRRQYRFARKPEPRWKALGSRFRFFIIAAFSAASGAFIESASNGVQTYVAPFVTRASCNLRELVRSNDAPDRFTVIMVPFQGDNGPKTSIAISAALSKEYSVNVIQSCVEFSVPAGGDHDLNVRNVRDKAEALLRKYDADALMIGEIDQGVGRFGLFDRGTVKYLNDPRVRQMEEFDPLKIDSFVFSLYGSLLSAARTGADKIGCDSPLMRVCADWARDVDSRWLLSRFKRYLHFQKVLFNKSGLFQLREQAAASDFAGLGEDVSAIGMRIATEQGTWKIDIDGESKSVLDESNLALSLIDAAYTRSLKNALLLTTSQRLDHSSVTLRFHWCARRFAARTPRRLKPGSVFRTRCSECLMMTTQWTLTDRA